MTKTFLILLIAIPVQLTGQFYTLTGTVSDPGGNALPYATVALLSPVDSALVNVTLTGNNGMFALGRVPAGGYILQIAFVGYQTFFRQLKIPSETEGDLGMIVLRIRTREIDAVQVTAERIPMLIRNDTVEYNADVFKTKPDAVAEDLLRKLPGIEVDRNGNVKAMGEDVRQVFVDGKEFFNPDPKVATKNLPAESIDKVQVYDKKSDESELLGIDDSEYDKTINFVLKEGARKAVIGDLQAGGGIPDTYMGRGKVYRFSEKHQVAMLGMINNVNKPGFSFEDYLNFNGGLRNSISSGGGVQFILGGDDEIPVDFGQQVTGMLTSGAAGVNYSFEPVKNNRLNFSYMGNGSQKQGNETAYSRIYTENGSFEQQSEDEANGSDLNHLLNLGWRNKAGSRQHFMLNGIVSYRVNQSKSGSFTESFTDGLPVNALDNTTRANSEQLTTSAEGSWLTRVNDKWKMVKLTGNARYSEILKKSNWLNQLNAVGTTEPVPDAQYFRDSNYLLRYEAGLTALRSLGRDFYLEPSVGGGYTRELLSRSQGVDMEPELETDSLSPEFYRRYPWMKAGLTFKKYTRKTKLSLGVTYLAGKQEQQLNQAPGPELFTAVILPRLNMDYEYKTGRRLGFQYTTDLTVPVSQQLIPVISTSNPLMQYFGNNKLKAEYRHNLHLSWHLFDQFSFTSLFAGINGTYIKSKINRSIEIHPDLRQSVTLVNVPHDYTASVYLDFSTPLRFLGVNITVGVREQYNKGISFVNSIRNTNTNYGHNFRLKFDNRRKDVWDAEVGAAIGLTNAVYSIQEELNSNYYNYTAFGEIRYKPSDHWHFRFTADVTSYETHDFQDAVNIPLLSAEINYYISKGKRAMLTLEAADLMNKNTGISRESDRNYLREVHSQMLGRYMLLSFKYKLNPSGTY